MVPKSIEEVQRYFDQYKIHWIKCIECKEDYFEECKCLIYCPFLSQVNTVSVLISFENTL